MYFTNYVFAVDATLAKFLKNVFLSKLASNHNDDLIDALLSV